MLRQVVSYLEQATFLSFLPNSPSIAGRQAVAFQQALTRHRVDHAERWNI
jgi:hypothetical protein